MNQTRVTDQQDSNVHPRRGATRQEATEAHLAPLDGVLQGETHPLAHVERQRRRGASELDLVLSCDGHRLRCPGEDAESVQLRRADGTMLVETNVTTVVLVMIRSLVAAVVPVAGLIVAAAAAVVLVSLAGSFMCI